MEIFIRELEISKKIFFRTEFENLGARYTFSGALYLSTFDLGYQSGSPISSDLPITKQEYQPLDQDLRLFKSLYAGAYNLSSR
jgi:hypothetical protein